MAAALPLKLLLGLGLSGGLVGSGSLLAGALGDGGVRYEYETVDTPPREYEPKSIKDGYHYHIHYTVNEAKSYREEGLSVLNEKNGTWHPLLYDRIDQLYSQYIYYIERKDGSRIRIRPEKPKRENNGIYAG